jgi:hypothetical protein
MFVTYHSVHGMGYDFEPADRFSFLTRKRLTFLEKTIGRKVWVIRGERDKSKQITYNLLGFFIPDEIEDLDDAFCINGMGQGPDMP